jgi:methionyl-tRNA synthetase
MFIDTTLEESFDAFAETQKSKQSEKVREIVQKSREENALKMAASSQLPVNQEFNKT